MARAGLLKCPGQVGQTPQLWNPSPRLVASAVISEALELISIILQFTRNKLSSLAEVPMIVCICNAIRECDIREVARTGMTKVDEIYEALGHEPNCCQCLSFAEEIVREECCAAA